MPNIYDYAYELEKAIRNSDDYKNLRKAFEHVMNDAGSKKMFEDFRDFQMELQMKQMQGEQPSEEELQNAQKRFEVIQQHPAISQLLAMEDRMNVVMADISNIVSKPLEEVYRELEEE